MNNLSMNMNGVNPAAMNAMANGPNGIKHDGDGERPDLKRKLNTCIYDYLLKNGQYDVAKALHKSSLGLETQPKPPQKVPDTDVGGEDSKDDIDTKKPPDLPYPKDVPSGTESSFLLDWFQLFWEMWLAPRNKSTPDAHKYLEHTRQQSKMRQQEQANLLRQPTMMAGAMPQNYRNMMQGVQPNMMANELARRAQNNSLRGGMSQQQAMMLAQRQQQQQQQQQMAAQQQMERAGSEVDVNGRPRTPSSGDNAPSPSKRPRLEAQFPGQQGMPNGRFAPGMTGQQMMNNQMHAHALLKQNDIDPTMLSQTNYNTFQNQPPNVQQRSIDVYSATLAAQHRQKMPQMNGQGGPIMQPGMEGMEFYANNMRPGMAQNGGGQGSSNHALQDYQMQLMLLEQQNKKRLLMARQEQDNSIRPDGAPGMPGQAGFAQNMSPSGSRNGPSPNPSEQMKRGTPKMNQVGLPGSPMPDGSMPHGRGSPGAMNFNNGMGMDMMQQAMKGGEGMPMGQNMRPPSSHPAAFNGGPVNPAQMEAMRAAQGGRMPNGAPWPQGPQGQAPGVPQPAQAQNGQMGTPRTGNTAMPPPTVPAANNNASNANGRPPSPAQPAAAGTPQTTNKPAPAKKGKAKEGETRKRPNKKASTAATPSAENENPLPPTPTPQTPITPMHNKSFNDNNKNNNAAPAQATAAPANINVPAPAPQIQQQQPDTNNFAQFEGMANFDAGGMDFINNISNMDTGDVLENFDFDAFLQSDEGNDFSDLTAYNGNFDGLETSADG